LASSSPLQDPVAACATAEVSRRHLEKKFTPTGVLLQVPVGTVVYLPEEKDLEDQELPFWVTNPGEPWVGARDYRSDDEDTPGGTTEVEASSEETLKRRLGREVADLKWRGQRFVLAVGGEGGRGNASFPSKTSK